MPAAVLPPPQMQAAAPPSPYPFTAASSYGSCPPPAGSSAGPQGKLGTPAMSGLLYDVGAYRADLRQSVGPGQYVLAATSPHCRACLPGDPRVVAGPGAGDSECVSQSLVDVESDLHNINRRATNAPLRPLPRRRRRADRCGAPVGTGAVRPYPSCDGIPTVDTRLANPPCTLRGTGWNRFEWLCQDPQQHALLGFNANVDTSILVKDAHRPFLARLVDPTLALPPGKRDRDASVGAPQWIPKTCNGVGNVDEPPSMLYRSCDEVARITDGCR